MNIDDLTFGELKEIAAIFQPSSTQKEAHPFVGEYVILRCHSAGVHAGELVSQNGDVAVLKNARRLWSWKTNSGVALNGVSVSGLAAGCKVDVEIATASYTGVIETIPCTKDAQESIRGYK